MPEYTPLVATIVVGLSLAFVLGTLAQWLRISPIAGYLLAGIVVGPYTPGFVADQALALELAEIGIILLMFGVGLHFSLKDLMSVRAIAIPGAIFQIAVATLLGLGLGSFLGWSPGTGIVFGLALSVASTVVLIRALQERRLLGNERGRIAVGWLIVEDIVMIFALVLLPVLTPLLLGGELEGATLQNVLSQVAYKVAMIAAFVVVMLLIGRRVIPLVLHYIAHTGSRELFRLGVLAIALGVAYASAKLFGASFALGAFFAGMILSESELSQRAAAESLPLRDAFAVLFFVSVGMLFNPAILLTDTIPVVATVAIIVIGKSLAALAIVLAFRHPMQTALLISASLAQIGEFSFILAGLGVQQGLLDASGRDYILAGALLSILVNPLLFLALDRFVPEHPQQQKGGAPVTEPRPKPAVPQTTAPADQPGRTILIGYGRVGQRVAQRLEMSGTTLHVIDEDDAAASLARSHGYTAHATGALAGLQAVDPASAEALIIAIPDVFEAGQIVEQARRLNPTLAIIARGHSEAELEHLQSCGASAVVLGAGEIARAIVDKYRSELASA